MLLNVLLYNKKGKKVINLGITKKPHWFQASASKLLGDD